MSGYMFSLGNKTISWSAKRQATIVLLICEAKTNSQIQAIKEAIWLICLLEKIDPSDFIHLTNIYSNNQGAIMLAKTLSSCREQYE
jgi:hypothetical protein